MVYSIANRAVSYFVIYLCLKFVSQMCYCSATSRWRWWFKTRVSLIYNCNSQLCYCITKIHVSRSYSGITNNCIRTSDITYLVHMTFLLKKQILFHILIKLSNYTKAQFKTTISHFDSFT